MTCTRVGNSVGLSYGVWLRPEAGEHSGRKAALTGTLSKKSTAAGPPRIDLLGGTLTWEPGANGVVRFRVLSGDLELCPTSDRDAAKVDPADAKWKYR